MGDRFATSSGALALIWASCLVSTIRRQLPLANVIRHKVFLLVFALKRRCHVLCGRADPKPILPQVQYRQTRWVRRHRTTSSARVARTGLSQSFRIPRGLELLPSRRGVAAQTRRMITTSFSTGVRLKRVRRLRVSGQVRCSSSRSATQTKSTWP